MTGKHSGVVKQILERGSNATWKHCVLYREALVANDMVPVPDEALQESCSGVWAPQHIIRVYSKEGHNIFERSDNNAVFEKKVTVWLYHLFRLETFPSACQEAQQLVTAAKNNLKKTLSNIALNFKLCLTTTSQKETQRHRDNANAWIRDPINVNNESIRPPTTKSISWWSCHVTRPW